jgi:hypothetical protein
MADVERAGFSSTKRVRLPLPGPLALFVISDYEITADGAGT